MRRLPAVGAGRRGRERDPEKRAARAQVDALHVTVRGLHEAVGIGAHASARRNVRRGHERGHEDD